MPGILDIINICAVAIFKNEVGDSKDLPYCFSDPDGVKTGKSGWSFGRCQFDTQNNEMALDCLRDCGFSENEISDIINQCADMDKLNAKLLGARGVVDGYDKTHIGDSVSHCLKIIRNSKPDIHLDGNMRTWVLIVDYHNQFYFSYMGKLHKWLKSQRGMSITPEMIEAFKFETAWGIKRPEDVDRRNKNIKLICDEYEKTGGTP